MQTSFYEPEVLNRLNFDKKEKNYRRHSFFAFRKSVEKKEDFKAISHTIKLATNWILILRKNFKSVQF